MGQTYPLPLTAAMLTPANAYIKKPDTTIAGDWHTGIVGNDVDIATATVAGRGAASATDTSAVYSPRTQADKAAAMGLELLGDLGKDYGEFSGETGRTGWTEPNMPYGPEPEPEE